MSDPAEDRAAPTRAVVARLGLACGVCLMSVWFVASIWFPFGWDQGILAWVGDTIVRGGIPYRDSWDMKGPLSYYGFALAEWLFGRHMYSIRLIDAPLLILGMVALAAIVARMTSRPRGHLAAIAFGLWIASLTWFHTSQPDTWAAVLITVAVCLLFSKDAALRAIVCSGLIVGCAGLIKPLYLAFVSLPLARILEQRLTAGTMVFNAKQFHLRSAAVIGAVLAPPALTLAWFAQRGAVRDFVDVHLLYTWNVYSAGAPAQHWTAVVRAVVRFLFSGPVVFALPVIAVGIYSLCRNSKERRGVVLTWLAVAFLCVAAQRRFFIYHWVIVYPPLVLVAAIGVDSLCVVCARGPKDLRRRRSQLLSRVALGFAIIALLNVARVPVSAVGQWLEVLTGRIRAPQYYDSHRAGPFVAGDDIHAAVYIQERTSPADTVAVYGYNAGINFLSGRKNPTRFGFALPLIRSGRMLAEYRREYIDGLHRSPPAVFIVGVFLSPRGRDGPLGDFSELKAFLDAKYRFETRIGSLDLYRLNPSRDLAKPGVAHL
jgi:hypothetical protein